MSEDIHHDEQSLEDIRRQIGLLVMSIEGDPKSCKSFTTAFNTPDMLTEQHESLLIPIGQAHKRIFDAHHSALPEENQHDPRCVLAPPNPEREEWENLGSEY